MDKTYKSDAGTGTVFVWEGGQKVVNDEGNVDTVTIAEGWLRESTTVHIKHRDKSKRHVILVASGAVDVWGFDKMD